MFSLQKNWKTRKQNRFCLEARVVGLGGGEREAGQGGEVAQTMYTHMNKCKNNKKEKEIYSKSKRKKRGDITTDII
jgi:hypothetical protein